MSNNRLEWQALLPDTEIFNPFFIQPWNKKGIENMSAVQPRLFSSLHQLQQTLASFPLLLLRCTESQQYLTLLAQAMTDAAQYTTQQSVGGYYQWENNAFLFRPVFSVASPAAENFTTLTGTVCTADWIEEVQLFGTLHLTPGGYQLQPGLLHRANGGTLIMPLRTLLAQPRLWLRLRQTISQQRFDWLSSDERRPLPVVIESMPLQVRLLLTGDRDALAEFQEIEPELSRYAIYSEYEDDMQLAEPKNIIDWCQWVHTLADMYKLPAVSPDFWPVLYREGARYTGDQEMLPLCSDWLLHQLRHAASAGTKLNGKNLQQALKIREWQESYLYERILDDILLNQVLIETEGEAEGQINGLSVVDFPGHPRAFGEPSRLSCVVHIGDGELTDVERKAELGGNIHAKGMMIMQAYLMAELDLEQQLPFSASIVFEQSYSEVDGDSASLAELCALISALAQQPLKQSIAVTGSVDQFGRVQAVGGVNEKIEGFFRICQSRELTGLQGVIIPASNVRHLCLAQDVIDAVREEQFHIWAIESVDEAIVLLSERSWRSEDQEKSLLQLIQNRITQITQQDRPQRPWVLRWLNWFTPN
ncbi:AAA family ATPase [Enterobacteriaceae bacterium LUAb1]